MDRRLFWIVLAAVVSTVGCRSLEGENATESLMDVAEGLFRTGRARSGLVYANLVSCAVKYDASCFVDAAGDFLEQRKNELLVQADSEFVKSQGRADPEATPSHVAKSIEKLLSELSGLFKDSLLDFFGGRQSEEEDEVVDSDSKDNGTSRAVKEEARKKKKKKPLKSLIAVIKIGIIAAIAVGKITLLLKIFEAALKFKFLLIAAGSFLINALKFWFDMKANKHHEENIVYRNPYENSGDWSGGPPGEYNARAYDIRKEYAQNMAYKAHKPK